jgi:hypothetical protein
LLLTTAVGVVLSGEKQDFSMRLYRFLLNTEVVAAGSVMLGLRGGDIKFVGHDRKAGVTPLFFSYILTKNY